MQRAAIIASALTVASLAAACGTAGGGSAGRLDPRALVAQPRDVGGLRVVTGSWNELGDDGYYPLSAALGGKVPPRHLAFEAGYTGAGGAALGADVSAMAVVLPDTAAAAKLLASTNGIEGFVGGPGVAVAHADPPGSADAALSGAGEQQVTPVGPIAVVAWTKGRLYGYVSATGAHARALAARVASAQERRFERALDGDRLGFDALLAPVVPKTPPFPPELGRTIHPAGGIPRIDAPGRYSLRRLGAGRLVFSPAAGDAGIQFPVELALPPSSRGRWLWRVTTHVIVKLAAHPPLGQVGIYPHVANTGGPGAAFDAVRDLGDGRTVLIEETRHTIATGSIEVSTTAMMGGNPSPRQQALVGFAVSYGAKGALESVTVLPDSAIEVFDDPAKVGCCAITTRMSRALP